ETAEPGAAFERGHTPVPVGVARNEDFRKHDEPGAVGGCLRNESARFRDRGGANKGRWSGRKRPRLGSWKIVSQETHALPVRNVVVASHREARSLCSECRLDCRQQTLDARQTNRRLSRVTSTFAGSRSGKRNTGI